MRHQKTPGEAGRFHFLLMLPTQLTTGTVDREKDTSVLVVSVR